MLTYNKKYTYIHMQKTHNIVQPIFLLKNYYYFLYKKINLQIKQLYEIYVKSM